MFVLLPTPAAWGSLRSLRLCELRSPILSLLCFPSLNWLCSLKAKLAALPEQVMWSLSSC